MRKPVEEEPPREQRAVQSVEVGGRLLLAMAEHPAPMTLKDLAAHAGLPPSRAHPYLVSYGKLGLVQQDATSGRYALGPAALRIGLTCLFQLDPIKAAVPVAEALAAATGQAVALAVWGNFGPTVVRLIEARQPLHVAMRAGTVMAMFGTATGRAFVGALPRERLLQALGGPLGGALDGLAHGGPQASLAPAQLDAERGPAQAELQAHGVTRAVGRPIPGVNAFSAPVRDHEGEVALVITMLGHQDHFPSAWSSPMAAAVRDAATQVSASLGYRLAKPSPRRGAR
ncbi:IclR family transcriptional regulator [Variovorax sp. YR752]|uniref:IclR family transcriptional regulator n=1 Tax=Variovorax sp. YR752 TaxID=1884383 RepID=UPI003138060B